jgi:ribonuclease P protein component
VLPAENRLRSSAQFVAVTRRGRRARSGELVVYLMNEGLQAPVSARRTAGTTSAAPGSVVGLVVGKSVGGSVVRHRVSRRLRAQLALRLPDLPRGALVVRALPDAATATSAALGRDLDAALAKLTRMSGR